MDNLCAPDQRRQSPHRRTHLILRILQRAPRCLIEPLQHLDLNGPALAAADVVQDTVDRLLRVVARDSRLCIRQKSGVCVQRLGGTVEGQKEQLRGLLERLEPPVVGEA